MRRIKELISGVRARYPQDAFFDRFEESCKLNPDKNRYYRTYDDALRSLDPESFETLKNKAFAHFKDHRPGQLKQGFFNQLNEAFAYRWLKNRDTKSIEILKEDGTTKPDIRFRCKRTEMFCEVKTIGISDDEIKRRKSRHSYDGKVYEWLENGFFCKFKSSYSLAKQQVAATGNPGFVFMVMIIDDIAEDHYSAYRSQILEYCHSNNITDLYIKVGLRGRKKIHLTKR